MTTIIPKTDNTELKKFYAWWLEEAAKHEPIETVTNFGLCMGLNYWRGMTNHYAPQYKGPDLAKLQLRLFEEYANLNDCRDATPFNEKGEYMPECSLGQCHRNPQRIAFVKAQLG